MSIGVEHLVHEARSRLVDVSLVSLLAVGYLILPVLLLITMEAGIQPVVYVHAVVLAIGTPLVIMRRRLSLEGRCLVLAGVAFATSLGLLVSFGIAGSGFFGMTMFAAVTMAIVLGVRPALIVLGAHSALYLSFMLVHLSGHFRFSVDLASYIATPAGWISSLAGFLLQISIPLLGLWRMNQLLREHIEQHLLNRERSDELERLRAALFDSTDSFLLITDDAGSIIDCNRSFKDFIGWSGDTPASVRLRDFVAAPAQLVENFTAAREPGRRREDEWRPLRGDRRLVSWSSSRIGAGQQVLISGLDITEERQMQLQAEESARLAAVGRLAGGIAHDFNNLLTAIGNNAEVGRHYASEQAQLGEILDAVLSDARRADAMVRELLNFAGSTSGTFAPVNVSSLCAMAVKTLALEHSAGVSMQAAPESLHVAADAAGLAGALYQLGHILCGMNNDALKLTLKRWDREDGMRFAEMRITGSREASLKTLDAGIQITRIRECILKHGGEIALKPGLRILLPLLPAAPFQEPRAERIRILAVDDQPVVAASLMRMIALLGHDCVSATSGDEALRCIDAGGIDLVIADWMMPGLSGPTLLNAIRLRSPALPVIISSGYGLDSDCAAVVAADDAVHFLAKPYSREDLAEMVTRAAGVICA